MLPKQLMLVVGITVGCVVGCGRSSELSSVAASRIRAVTMVYLDYAAAKGVGPANERELLGHCRNVPAALPFAEAGEQILLSDRDGEEFVVRYGLPVCPSRGKSAPVIAYEHTGKDGKVLAAYADGTVACVSQADFRQGVVEKR